MSATATNSSAALCGAFQAACLIVCFTFAEHLLHSNDVRWLVNMVVLCIIFFVPFFKWVIGADFKYNGQGLTLPALDKSATSPK
jgi:Na+-driven multidrug efflux pump